MKIFLFFIHLYKLNRPEKYFFDDILYIFRHKKAPQYKKAQSRIYDFIRIDNTHFIHIHILYYFNTKIIFFIYFSTALERKISVRANRDELVQKGILLPESPISPIPEPGEFVNPFLSVLFPCTFFRIYFTRFDFLFSLGPNAADAGMMFHKNSECVRWRIFRRFHWRYDI